MTKENKRILCDGIGALCILAIIFMLPFAVALI